MADITLALRSLCPGANFAVHDDDYDQIFWQGVEPLPSKEAVLAEVARLQAIEDANAYKAKRASEYPPIQDYIDGVVKGDQAQIQAYIDACLAVKAKYPKGETNV